MSGPMQRLLGPVKPCVYQAIEEANALLDTPLDEDFDKDETVTETLINRLTTNILTLERCKKDWTGVLKDLKGEAKSNDKNEYVHLAEGDEGFIETR